MINSKVIFKSIKVADDSCGFRRLDVSDAESGQESQGSSKKTRPQSSRPTVGEAGESGKPDKKAGECHCDFIF